MRGAKVACSGAGEWLGGLQYAAERVPGATRQAVA